MVKPGIGNEARSNLALFLLGLAHKLYSSKFIEARALANHLNSGIIIFGFPLKRDQMALSHQRAGQEVRGRPLSRSSHGQLGRLVSKACFGSWTPEIRDSRTETTGTKPKIAR
jgi:hypothetical protein